MRRTHLTAHAGGIHPTPEIRFQPPADPAPGGQGSNPARQLAAQTFPKGRAAEGEGAR